MDPTLRDLDGELEKGVKKKVSDVLAAPLNQKKVETEALLSLIIKQRENLGEMHKASKLSLHNQFKYGVLLEGEFLEELRDVQQKEREIFAGDVTIAHNRDRILRNMQALISQNSRDEREASREIDRLFWDLIAHKGVDRDAEQKMFQQDLIGYYQCQPGGPETEIWCPIYQSWYRCKKMKAAHLVPFKLEYQTMGDLFVEEGRGHELMWSIGNGLMMHEDFEEAYKDYVFCLVPIEKPGQPDGWKFILIDEAKRFQLANGTGKWDSYDGRELKFLNDERPSRRFLYLHYFFCVYKAMQERTAGWQKVREKSESRQLWATPGSYLRATTLQKLAELVDDEVELPIALLADGEIIKVKPLKEEIEVLDAKDLASALLSVEDDDEF